MSSYPEDDEEGFNPLDGGAAAMPTIIGGGCLARFDPDELNDASGADFEALSPGGDAGASALRTAYSPH